MTTYTERDSRGPVRNGDHGGDRGVTDSWNRRFVRQLPHGRFAVIDVDFYVVEEPGGRWSLERETSFTLCSDPTDPGRSEEWSDTRYDDVAGTPTDAAARKACAAVKPGEFTWDGTPFR